MYAAASIEIQGLPTYEELHLRNFLINLLHELYDEINQLVLKHLFRMEVGNQEGNVISLKN